MTAVGSGQGFNIDWDAVRMRLAQAIAATKGATSPSPEETHRILEARARALAQPATPLTMRPAAEVMIFRLGAADCGIETRYVRSIHRRGSITPVPGLPSHYVGIASFAGMIHAVADPAPMIGLSSGTQFDGQWLVLLGRDAAELAVLVDAVIEIRSLTAGDMSTVAGSSGPEGTHRRGLLADGTVLIDVGALLADSRLEGP